MKFLNFFLFLCELFALLDPDTDPLTWLKLNPIRIRNTGCTTAPGLGSWCSSSPSHFCGSFLPSWIRIRIPWPDWIWIQSGSETLGVLPHLAWDHGAPPPPPLWRRAPCGSAPARRSSTKNKTSIIANQCRTNNTLHIPVLTSTGMRTSEEIKKKSRGLGQNKRRVRLTFTGDPTITKLKFLVVNAKKRWQLLFIEVFFINLI